MEIETKEKIIDALEGKKTFDIELDKKIIRIEVDDNPKSLENFFLPFYLSNKQGRKMLIKKYAKNGTQNKNRWLRPTYLDGSRERYRKSIWFDVWNRIPRIKISKMTDTKIETKEQPCLAEACAKQMRKERGLSEGSPVAVYVDCPCPKCKPKC